MKNDPVQIEKEEKNLNQHQKMHVLVIILVK